MGGDEFVVAALLSRAAVGPFMERWGQRLELTVPFAGTRIEVRGSVGTAVVSPYEVQDLISLADKAMYEVKLGRPTP
jgi:GGDEF domain-containing protein